jgi:hypothetical protein
MRAEVLLMITVHVLGLTMVVQCRSWRPFFARYKWGVIRGEWPTVYAGPVKVITGPRGIGWWMAKPIEIEHSTQS